MQQTKAKAEVNIMQYRILP